MLSAISTHFTNFASIKSWQRIQYYRYFLGYEVLMDLWKAYPSSGLVPWKILQIRSSPHSYICEFSSIKIFGLLRVYSIKLTRTSKMHLFLLYDAPFLGSGRKKLLTSLLHATILATSLDMFRMYPHRIQVTLKFTNISRSNLMGFLDTRKQPSTTESKFSLI